MWSLNGSLLFAHYHRCGRCGHCALFDHSVSIGILQWDNEKCQEAIAPTFALFVYRRYALSSKVCWLLTNISHGIYVSVVVRRRYGITLPLSRRSDGTIAREPPPGSSSYYMQCWSTPFDFLLPTGRSVSSIGERSLSEEPEVPHWGRTRSECWRRTLLTVAVNITPS